MRSSDAAFDAELRAEYAAAALEYAADPDFILWKVTLSDGSEEGR